MKTTKLVVILGKGTAKEKRIETSVNLYWSETWKMWMSIPEKENH